MYRRVQQMHQTTRVYLVAYQFTTHNTEWGRGVDEVIDSQISHFSQPRCSKILCGCHVSAY